MDRGAAVTARGAVLGRVVSFDAARGLGEVEGADGARFGFHATAIGDGSRHIEAGTTVAFSVAPGHGGRYEVRSLSALGASAAASPAG